MLTFQHAPQVKCHACVGGTSVREDTRILQAGVHVVVGTPGRVYDMLRRRALRADSIRMFVLDEADEMLSRGFKDQIYDIFQLLPPKLQVRFVAQRAMHCPCDCQPALLSCGDPAFAASTPCMSLGTANVLCSMAGDPAVLQLSAPCMSLGTANLLCSAAEILHLCSSACHACLLGLPVCPAQLQRS